MKPRTDSFPNMTIESLADSRRGAIKIGPFGSQLRKEEMVSSGWKVYGQENVISENWSLGNRRVTDAKFRALGSCRLSPGDVVLTMMGTVGKCAAFPDEAEPGLMDSHLLRIQPDPKRVDAGYLRLVIQADEIVGRQITQMSHGTIMSGLSSGIVRRLRIPVPPLAEQMRIAEILQSVDYRIRRAEQLVAKLQRTRDGLVRDLLTRGIDDNGRLRDSFGTRRQFKDSTLGPIPECWNVARLSTLISRVQAGVSVNSEDRPHGHGEIGVLKTSSVSGGGFYPSENKAVVARERRRVRVSPLADSIIVSRMNTPALVGASAYVKEDHPDLFLPDRLWLLTFAHNAISVRWLSFILAAPVARRFIELNSTGTSGSMKNLPQETFLQMLVGIPPVEEQRELARRLDVVSDAIESECRVVHKLQSLRIGLLDDLLTGRTRVTKLPHGNRA